MINIVFIIDYMLGANGGTEGQLLMLLNRLDKTRFNVHLFCLRNTDWLNNNRLDFPVEVLNIKRLFTANTLLRIFKFRKYCRAHDIHIVQTYFNDSFIFGVSAARLSGIKNIIVCRRNLGPGFWGNKALLFVYRILRYITPKYLANSHATRESVIKYEGISPDRINVIYNGLDMKRFDIIDDDYRLQARRDLGIDGSQILVGMVSHMRKDKNFELFLDAAARVHKSHPETQFMILGEGPYRPNIERRIEDLGLQDSVSLIGSVNDVVPYLAAMDIACLTTDGESFSNSILEYLAAGLPVVATEVGGNIEALKENGFLFPRNNLEKLVDLLTALIQDKQMRCRVGISGRTEAASHYGVGKMISEYEEVFLKVRGTL